jgi:hypothetical protein
MNYRMSAAPEVSQKRVHIQNDRLTLHKVFSYYTYSIRNFGDDKVLLFGDVKEFIPYCGGFF